MKLPGCLSKLNEEQHTYLISLLSMGKYDGQIADAIIEKGWIPDVKRPTLLKNVNRWRRNHGQQAVVQQVKDHLLTTSGKLKRQIDVMEELTALVIKQKERLSVILKQEDGKPLLLSSVSSELTRLTSMLERLAKLQMETGLLRKVKTGEVEGDYADVEEEGSQFVEVFTDEEQKLLEMVSKAIEVSSS